MSDWAKMSRADFGHKAQVVQESLFSNNDAHGTPDLVFAIEDDETDADSLF